MSVTALGIISGLPYFFVKLAVPELSPLVIAWGRVSLATLILLPIAWQRGALRASLITYINPLVATLLGVWLLRQHLGLGAIAGFALILAGSWLASRTAARTVRAGARAA